MDDQELLGRGLSYPLRFETGGGRLAQSAGVQKIEEAVLLILSTAWGERAMRPTFGANLASLVFAPNNATTANLARYYVREALDRWEPRIEVLDVVVVNDDDAWRLLIDINYQVRSTGEAQSLTVPFPLEAPS